MGLGELVDESNPLLTFEPDEESDDPRYPTDMMRMHNLPMTADQETSVLYDVDHGPDTRGGMPIAVHSILSRSAGG